MMMIRNRNQHNNEKNPHVMNIKYPRQEHCPRANEVYNQQQILKFLKSHKNGEKCPDVKCQINQKGSSAAC